ncbi:hypothetical protein EDF58_102570 [Novosphingobium sp. PhB57]|uniref:hypothetical protein n=1 Tax=Novosphingobium sp. PhB57 TaxID=2485107 RepID=UPI0010445590|nr:hypothetical protein [Novosphingobium sp. PhB57]TCU59881.1 hypothetical protein EDF58_102570 [Novosphingobium sp. PhB57]
MTPARHATRLTLLLAASACLSLGACKKEEAPAQNAATGAKILPRSVSDDMLPYDTVRSQSPMAAPVAETRSGRSATSSSASEAALPQDTAADAAAAAAADVEAAAAQPSPQP